MPCIDKSIKQLLQKCPILKFYIEMTVLIPTKLKDLSSKKNHLICGTFLQHPVRKPTNLHLICRMPSSDTCLPYNF